MSFHIENDIIKEKHTTPNAVWYATTGWRHEIGGFIHLKWLLLQERSFFLLSEQ